MNNPSTPGVPEPGPLVSGVPVPPPPQHTTVPKAPAAFQDVPSLASFGQLLSESFRIFFRAFKVLWPWVLGLFVLSLLPILELVGTLAKAMLLPVAFLLVVQLQYRGLPAKITFRHVWSYVVPMAIVRAMVFFIIIAVVMLPLIPVMLVGAVLKFPLAFLGIIPIVVLAIILQTWLGMSQYVVVLEGKRWLDAPVRSAGLILGSTPGVFLRWLLFAMVVGLPLLLITLLFLGGTILSALNIDLSDLKSADFPAIAERLGGLSQENIPGIFALGLWSQAIGLLSPLLAWSFGFALYQNLSARAGGRMAEEKRGLFKTLAILGLIGFVLVFIGAIAVLAFIGFSFMQQGVPLPI